MSTTGQAVQQKWLRAIIVLFAILIGFIANGFLLQIGDWTELESKIKFYKLWINGLAVVVTIATAFILFTHKKWKQQLEEIYTEAIKVVWPDKNETVRSTVGIVIGVTIVGFVLGLFDFIVSRLLTLIH